MDALIRLLGGALCSAPRENAGDAGLVGRGFQVADRTATDALAAAYLSLAVVAEKLLGHVDSEKTQEPGEGVAIFRP